MQTGITRTKQIVTLIVLCAASLVLADVAHAGPPLICHQFDAGNARLLPWGATESGWNSPDRSYNLKNLTADTLTLLSPDAPVLARMENLRRATIYASQHEQIAADLLTAVLARAQADAGRGTDPLAWFDAGYLVESFRQATYIYKWDMLEPAKRAAWTLRRTPRGVDGYRMVTKALTLMPSPEIEFAASLMKEGAAGVEHRRRATAGAAAGSLLVRNLTTP